MKTRLLFLFVLFAMVTQFAQTEYPLVTLRDIQYLADSVIAKGDAPSPLNGDTVRVRGVIMVSPVVDPSSNRHIIISAGGRWVTYIQDPTDSAWCGLNVLQNDTSTAGVQNTFFDLVDTAQVVEFTGVVTEYNTTTELMMLLNPVTPVNIVEQLPKRPDPIVLKLSDIKENNKLKNEAEKYEGMYVEFRNVITSDRDAGTSATNTFVINDDQGNKIMIYGQSCYYKRSSIKLRDYDPPINGSVLDYIRGIVTTRNDDYGYYLVPLYPNDMKISVYPPSIANIRRNVDVVGPDAPVNVSATIKDPDGWVKDAKVFYSLNGAAFDSIAMTKSADTTLLVGTIPGVKDSALVEFFIKATDNTGNTSMTPADTAKSNYFYLVLNRDLTIQDIQYSPFGSGYTGFNNYHVTVSGVVTADTSDLNGDGGSGGARVYMQNGSGPWSGIWLYGVEPLTLKKGDLVTVSGVIVESNNNTRIDTISQIIVQSSGNPVPEAVEVPTSDIGTLSNGTLSAEMYEGVLITYKDLNVTDDNADGGHGPNAGTNYNYGEILVADVSNVNTRVELQDGNSNYHNLWDSSMVVVPNVELLIGDKFESLSGVLWQSFSNYKLCPRKNDDFVGYIPVSVEDKKDVRTASYNLAQNYPNPFNPSTVISYSIPRDGFVKVKIFNVLGQEVKTLVNSNQKAGEYKVIFNADNMTSGIYLYQIQSGDYNFTKKMMLVK